MTAPVMLWFRRSQGEGPDLWSVITVSIIVMTITALAVGVSFGTKLYQAAFQTQTFRLVELAQSQARLIESMAEFDERYSAEDVPGGAWAATLYQIRDAHLRFSGFGETGEFTLARRDGDQIVFLLSHRGEVQLADPVDFHSDLAEPMRLALSGTSGTIVGLDYRGERVLAAYESMSELGVGIVAKIDLVEIRAPFVTATLTAAGLAVLIIFSGGFLLVRQVGPIVRDSEEHTRQLATSLANLKQATTLREIVQQDLTRQEQLLEHVFREGPLGMAVVNNKQCYVRVNSVLCEMLGYTEREMLDLTVSDITHPDDLERIGQLVDGVLDGKSGSYTAEKRYIRKDGEFLWAKLYVSGTIPGSSSDANRAIALVEDITEHKLASDNLTLSAKRLEGAVADRTRDLDASRQATLNMMSDSEADRREIQQLYEGLERKVEERTKELSEANEDLEAFSYSVSHDLKAPLRAISSFSNILREEHSDQLDEEARRLLGIVLDNASHMGQLIDDLLAFSRLGRAKLRPTQLDGAALVQAEFDTQTMETPDRDIELSVALPSPVVGDPTLVRQVFANLISNAFKFTVPREGAVIEVGFETIDGECVYYVKDNGVGFDMAHADKLFGVFQRLHYADEFPGTGVGLAIVQRIVNLHGGRVWAVAELDKGATFHFTLAPKAGIRDGDDVKPTS